MKKLVKTAIALSVAFAAQGASATYTNSFDSVDGGAAASVKSLQTSNSLGIGAVYYQEIYKGLDNETRAVPLVNMTYNGFYWHGFELGYNAYSNDRVTAAIVLKPMFNGYDASDSNELDGMDDRKMSAYAGGKVTVSVKPLKISMFVAQDVTGRTTGTEGGVNLATGLPLMDGKFIVSPFISATYWSSDITDYYYGVKASEATNTRSQYSADSTINYGAGINGFYRVSQNWLVRATYAYTYYGDEVNDSPIVDDRSSYAVLLGLSYVFN